MAILNRGILGGGRNAVGTVVMSRWKGKDVIRARVTPSNPRTPAQRRTRALFSGLAALASFLMDSFVRPYWTRFERGTTAYNEWMRANQAVMRSGLVAGLREPGVFDPLKAVLARGPLPAAEATGVAPDGPAATAVTFEPGAGAEDDAVAVVVLRKDGGGVVGTYAGFARGDGVATIPLASGDLERYAFHVLAYRPGPTARETALAVNSSVAMDGGEVVVVSAADRQAAMAASEAPPAVPEEAGALV